MPPLPAPVAPPEPAPVGYSLTQSEILTVAIEVNLLRVMGERKVRHLTVDYVPARQALALPRLEGDGPLTVEPPHVEELTFYLEDQMFGGEVFAAITCRGNVIVSPFVWSSWDALARNRIVLR